MDREKNIDFVLRTVGERGVRFVRLWFTDILGNLKSLAISTEDLEEAFEEGIGFDGSAVDGFAKLEESDMLAFPDPETFQLLPSTADLATARVFCDIRTPMQEDFSGDPRACLRRIFTEAESKGYIMNVGPEIEFFYFDDPIAPDPTDNAGYFDLTPLDSALEMRRDTTLTLERMSIPVEYSHHAIAPSQNGIRLRHAEALTCADNVVTARHVIKQVAYEQGMFASFMPKPFSDMAGSALFIHESIFDHDGNNLFWAPADDGEPHLSDLAKSFIAGLLAYAPEFSLVTNPTVNSYKRLVSSELAPTRATWGRRDRSAFVRVPTHKPGKTLSTRIELRSPDPTCNPYLAFAATLAAGIKGIEDKLELQPETSLDDPRISDAEAAASGIKLLPRDLGQAIEAFKGSSFMREVLGDHIYEYLIDVKTREWEEYCSTVTSWEQERYYAGF